MLPESEWDEGLRRTARRVTRETGKAVTMVLGGIQIRTSGGGIARARGVYSGTGIILQADNFKLSTDQIADHEIFHDYADSTPGLIQSVEQAIVERYGREEFDKILTTYIQKLRGVIDLPKNAAEAEIEDALLDVKNEVFADAYAGINAFGAHAEKYRDTTRQTLEERGVIASRENAAATDRRRGPPERFSYGGANANGANLESLREAQAMQEAGADMESIRRATGWHEGMDGKWRYEIDDSGMTYHRGGDAAFSRSHPDYAEYQKLMRKWMTGDVTAEEETRLRQLDEIWGREYGRLSERVESGDARLEDILDHEGLFRAYPQLRRTKVEFADLPKNTMGSYSPSQNLITLSSELRNAPESTLVHEIQHAIQNAEGFAKGSNRQYWEDRLTSGDEIQSKGFQDAREKLIQFQLDEANEEALALKDRMEKAEAQDDDLAEYDRLWEEAEQRGLDGKINEYYELRENYYTQMNRPGNSVPSELYYNTAGEIEARDVSKRRELTAEQRRETAPDYGSEDTVFADGGDGYAIGKTTGNKPFVEVEQDILAGVPEADWVKTVKENLKQKFPNGITVGNNEINIDKQSRREMTFSRYMQRLYNTDPQLRADKLRATNNADEILRAATDWVNEGLNHPRKDNIRDFARGEVLLRVGGNDYTADVVVGTRENGSMLMYDILNLQPTSFTEKETDAAITVNPSPGVGRSTASVSADSVAENGLPVKKRFSIDEPVEQTKDFIAVHNRDWSVIRDAADEIAAQLDPAAGVWDAAWDESINKNTARRGIAEGEPNAASPDGAALSDAQMPARQELEITARPAAADTREAQIRTAETAADEIAAQLDPAAGEIAVQPGTLAEAIASAQQELETSAEISSDTYLDQDKQFVEDPFDENGDLKKNVRYRSGDFKNYAYETDKLGRIIKAVADDLRLKLSKGRYRHDPNSPGKELGDEAGHLFADMFGGSPLKDNIVSQLKKVNRSDWAALEQAWKKALLNGQKVRVAIDVLYSGNSLRSDGFMVQYTIDGVQHSAVKLTISNI